MTSVSSLGSGAGVHVSAGGGVCSLLGSRSSDHEVGAGDPIDHAVMDLGDQGPAACGRPSTTHASHKGRRRSSSTDISRPMRVSSSVPPPGGAGRCGGRDTRGGSGDRRPAPVGRAGRGRIAPSAGIARERGQLALEEIHEIRIRARLPLERRVRGDVHVRDAVLDVEEQAVERAQTIHLRTSHANTLRRSWSWPTVPKVPHLAPRRLYVVATGSHTVDR